MPERRRVTARSGLRLRASPGDGDVIDVLDRGSEVVVLDRETWLRVRAGGREGFVSAEFVEPSAAPGSERAAPGAAVDIQPYEDARFVGAPVRADTGFFQSLDRLRDLAAEAGVEIFVTSSFRAADAALRGTVVSPARRSNHLVGHAIDMNVRSPSGFFNSSVLRRDNLAALPAEVRGFIQAVRDDADLRWGGDFDPEDPVHVDDDLNHRAPDLWQRKFQAL